VTENFWRELAHLVCYRPAMNSSFHNPPAGQGQNGREIFRINPPGLRRSFWISRFCRSAGLFRFGA
jgi:hypothetical protein